jgi:hypothetical protein
MDNIKNAAFFHSEYLCVLFYGFQNKQQHLHIGFYNWDRQRLLLSMNIIFMHNSG